MQLQAAADRRRSEMEARNRTAWSIAAMSGAAHAGKLRSYQDYFGAQAAPAHGPQVGRQMEVALRLLAEAWGAEVSPATAGNG